MSKSNYNGRGQAARQKGETQRKAQGQEVKADGKQSSADAVSGLQRRLSRIRGVINTALLRFYNIFESQSRVRRASVRHTLEVPGLKSGKSSILVRGSWPLLDGSADPGLRTHCDDVVENRNSCQLRCRCSW